MVNHETFLSQAPLTDGQRAVAGSAAREFFAARAKGLQVDLLRVSLLESSLEVAYRRTSGTPEAGAPLIGIERALHEVAYGQHVDLVIVDGDSKVEPIDPRRRPIILFDFTKGEIRECKPIASVLNDPDHWILE